MHLIIRASQFNITRITIISMRFLREKGVIYKVNKLAGDGGEPTIESGRRHKESEREEKEEKKVNSSQIVMEWVSANPHPKIIAGQKEEGYYTYVKPDGKSYKTLITDGYKTMVYKDLYPGIDVEYSFPSKGGMIR